MSVNASLVNNKTPYLVIRSIIHRNDLLNSTNFRCLLCHSFDVSSSNKANDRPSQLLRSSHCAE